MKQLRLFLANVTRRLHQSPQVVPPLGILSLSAYLRSRFNLKIRLFNLRLEPCTTEALAQRVIDFQPDIAGFGSLTPSAHMLGPLTRLVREALPKTLIVIGGPAVTAAGTSLLRETAADAAIPGEGELAFEALIREWTEGGRRLESLPGLWWRNPDGEIVQNRGQAPIVTDLDSLPYPAYDLIDVSKYRKHIPFGVVPYRRYVSIMTSRGCPFPCIYCQHALGNQFRAQSPERVVNEIEHYVRTYGVDTIEILDDIFNYEPQRVMGICELIARRNLKIHITFPNGMRGDLLSEEMIDALADAGMDHLTVALESGSPRIQEMVGKRLDIEKLVRNASYAGRKNILTQCYNMLGFPTETEAEMRRTVDIVLDLPVHLATFFTVTPFPGTELHRLARRLAPEKLDSIDWRDMETITAHTNVSAVPDAVLFRLQGEALRRFYLNPSRIRRVFRDHPTRRSLPYLGAILAVRACKGLLS